MALAGRQEAVGRAEPVVLLPQDLAQQGVRAAHLLLKAPVALAFQVGVAPAVVAHLVALVPHPAEEVLAARDPLAHQEEGGAGAPLPEAVQQAGGGVPAGSVVKGQGHEAALRRKLRRARRGAGGVPARKEGQEQSQKGAERPVFSPQSADLPASQIGLVCAGGVGFTLGIRGRIAMNRKLW